jgi:hypothetical protein
MKNKLTLDYLEKNKLFPFIFRRLFVLPYFFMEMALEPIIRTKSNNQEYKNRNHPHNYCNPIFYQISHIPNSRICYLIAIRFNSKFFLNFFQSFLNFFQFLLNFSPFHSINIVNTCHYNKVNDKNTHQYNNNYLGSIHNFFLDTY